jgi:type III secretion system YscD/HrpQ family protein
MPAHLIAKEGPVRGLILHFKEGEEWIVGRDPDEADFVIEDSTVSRKHARLTKTPEGIYCQNLSHTNPTLINNELQEHPVLLKEGDRVQIGNTIFFFSEEDIPELNEPSPKKLKIKKTKPAYDNIFGDLDEPQTNETPVREEITSELPSPFQKEEEINAHDTVFEDLEAGSDLPFHMISESPLLLKVISGPNAGAEIGIEKDRTYILGKSANSCDIVFQDLSVSRNHARLHVSADGVLELEDLGSKNGTIVNGQPILQKTVITPQDMIALGTTVFLIIDREAPQETIYSSVSSHFDHYGQEEEFSPAEEILDEAREQTDWKKAKIPPKYLIAASSCAFILLIVVLSFFSLFKSESVQIVQKEPVEEIQEALAKFPAVQFSFNPASGKIFLVGHVATAIQFQEMQYNIDQIPFISSVENTVIIDEITAKTMNDILSSNEAWRGVNISVPEPGKFLATGFIQTAGAAQKLNEYLNVNFPYLDKLDNQVTVEEILNAQITNLIASQQFGSLSFQLLQGDVILSGSYNETLETEYKALLKQIKKLTGVHSVKDFATPVSANAARIDLSQQYQVTGSSLFDGHAYSVVLNGKVFTLGDTVDGMKITSIESDTILLEKDGLKYKINYTL